MITFTPISLYKRGELYNIIHQCYANLINEYPEYWKSEEVKWGNFDKFAFDNKNIGKCLFITCLENRVIGLASWNTRKWPEYGIIGQNCILPVYRRNGYGVKQIEEVIKIFIENNVKRAFVTTSEHPFFESAHKKYHKLGFVEVRRRIYSPDPNYKVIDFKKTL